MTAKGLTTLNCTQCGVGLSVHGGGRVRTHVCSYCGAMLDAQDDYKVLARFEELPRPKSPFRLGSVATLFDVSFTVIGTIGWVERYGGETWRWVDHQVYSPTHGYAWLTWEDGQPVFTRKVRGSPRPAWISAREIDRSEHRPVVRFEGRIYSYYDSGVQRPTFIEGEFNYVPDLEVRVKYRSFLGDDDMFTMLREDTEQEYELSRLLPRRQTLRAFGASPGKWPKKFGVHPLQVFERSPLAAYTRNALLGAGAGALVLAAIFSSFGANVSHTKLEALDALTPLPFVVTNETGLVEIGVNTDIRNGWFWLEGEVLNAAGEVVAVFEDGTEYYAGRDTDGSWQEGSRRFEVRADLPTGEYELELAVSENVGDALWGGRPATRAAVTIREGVANLSWLLRLGGLLLAAGAAFIAHRAVHHKLRWAGSDWSDEDD